LKKDSLDENIILEKPIDFKKEAIKILFFAKKLFSEKKMKDAYGKAAEAIRFFYGHMFNHKQEMTNTDLIKLLKKNKIKPEKATKCLNLCGLVEFAKYKANKKDFDEIFSLAEKIIKQK
jgi:hypothetical protein